MEKKMCSGKVYSGIDLFKIIAAILVVLLHATETTDWYACEIKYVFTRLAVPFFFITSGFFFFQGLDSANNKREYFIRYEKKLLILFSIWALVLYLPFVVLEYVHNNPDTTPLKLALLLIRRIFIIGPGPYWYLIALAWSTVFLYFCYYKREFILKAAIILGLFFEICYTCFAGVLSQFFLFQLLFQVVHFVYSWEYNFFMFGIPFAGIGFLIGKTKLNWEKETSILILLASTLFRFFEYNLSKLIPSKFWETNTLSIGFILQAVAFFMLAKSVKLKWSYEKAVNVRQCSSFIYFVHAIILYNILNPLLSRYTTWPVYSARMIIPKVLMVLFLCLLLFVGIKKINNPRLNVLING